MVRITWLTLALTATAACTKNNPTFCDADNPCPNGSVCSVDNTCTEEFTLDTARFFDDGTTLWVADPEVTLTGTIVNKRAKVEIYSNGELLAGPAQINGLEWSIILPPGAIADGIATSVTVQQTLDGKRLTIDKSIAGDFVGPQVGVVPTQTLDESKDTITFDADGTPVHQHRPFPVVLTSEQCSVVPRYAHLFSTDAHARQNAPNPMAWHVSAQTRLAWNPAATRYRVTRGGEVVIDWTALTPAVGGTTVELAVNRELATAFAETAGKYDFEWEFTDWAMRTTTAKGCIDLVLLAPPLQISQRALTTDARSLSRLPLRTLRDIALGTVPVTVFERTVRNGTTLAEDVELDVANVEFVHVHSERTSSRDPEPVQDIPYPTAFFAGVSCESGYCDNMPQPYPSLPAPGADSSMQPLPWTLLAFDGAGDRVDCASVSGTKIRCEVPARDGATPGTLRFVATIPSMPALGGGINAGLVESPTYTGLAELALDRCFAQQGGPRGVFCVRQGSTFMHTKITSAVVEIRNTANTYGPDFALANGLVGRPTLAVDLAVTAPPFRWVGQ